MYAGFNDAKRSPVDHSERIAQLEATIARLEARATPQAAAAVDIKQWETNWHKMQLERERSAANMFMQQLHMVKEIMGMVQPAQQVVTPAATPPTTGSTFSLETMERLAKVFK
mgnify:CR=1 FL=1